MAQDKARGAIGQARGRISDQVDQRSTEAGERIAGTASDVRSIADELRSQGKDAPANLAEQVAGQADRVGDYLKGASGDRILRDVEDFARRQPMLVAAAGLALGFAASRFLKASSSRRYESGYQSYGDGGYDRASATSPYDTRTSYTPGPTTPRPPTPTTSGGRDVLPGSGGHRGPARPVAGRAAQAALGADHPAGPPGAGAGQGRDHPEGQAGRHGRRGCSAAPARSGWPPSAP